MRIEINNFGPIRKFEFDLEKDFHLIVGENNVGKSYAITTVYLILKSFIVNDELPNYRLFEIFREGIVSIPLLTEKIKQTKSSSSPVLISDEINSVINELISVSFLQNLKDSIAGTFESIETLSSQFSSDPLTIKITTVNFDIEIGVIDKQLSIKSLLMPRTISVRGLQRDRATKQTDKEIQISYNVHDESSLERKITTVVADLYFQLFAEVSNQVKSIHYLPASRSGLYQALSAFGQIIAELSKSRSFLSKKIELPGISEPLSDYFLKLSNISSKKRKLENTALNNIAQRIENEILNGKVEFDPKTKRLIFLPNGTSLKLDLSTTSSMVSELSPIVSYLRYVLTESSPRLLNPYQMVINRGRTQKTSGKPLVIIEEPEAHLHPEVQIKLTDIFAALANSGVKIIITSHSNYIFNKVNNLILSKAIQVESIHASVCKMTEKGSVRELLDTDQLGIDDKNFIDTSESLYEEKIELIKKLNRSDV